VLDLIIGSFKAEADYLFESQVIGAFEDHLCSSHFFY